MRMVWSCKADDGTATPLRPCHPGEARGFFLQLERPDRA
jgi:hypothetical protein|eukprot:COSAG01_NODE_5974_length_3920_cov_2.667800_3_plen_39_part_00